MVKNCINRPVQGSEHQLELADRQWLRRWVEAQGPVDWVIVTLTVAGKSVEDRLHLQKVLRQTLIRFEHKVLGSNAVKRRKDRLLCVPVFGGEPRNGTYLHYHLVLEKRSKHPMDLDTFRRLFEIEWNKQLPRLCRRKPDLTPPLIGEVVMEAADLKRFPGWLYYIQRWEGTTLESGLSKVDMKNLFLKSKCDDVTYTESLSCC